MEYNTKITGENATITIQGWLNANTAPTITEEVDALPEEVLSVVFDLNQLEYISSAGLRTIVYAHKQYASKGGVIIKGVSEDIYEIFSMAGLAKRMNIERKNE